MLDKITGLAQMIKQARDLPQRMADSRARLEKLTIECSTPDGQVKVIATGTQRIRQIVIGDALMKTGDGVVIADRVTATVNRALDEARQMAVKNMASLADEMQLPGLEQALTEMGID